MELVQNPREAVTVAEETSQGEGRREGWTSPRVVVGIFHALVGVASLIIATGGLFFILLTGLVGAYALMQTRAVSSEMSNAQLASDAADQRKRTEELQKLVAENETAHRDYHFKLGNDLTEIKTLLKQQQGQGGN